MSFSCSLFPAEPSTSGLVESAIANMNAILVKVNSNEGTIGMLMNDKTLYTNFNTSLKTLDSLVNHMNEHPDHFMAPLGKTKA